MSRLPLFGHKAIVRLSTLALIALLSVVGLGFQAPGAVTGVHVAAPRTSYPDETNTGYLPTGVTLTPSGGLTISTNGTVVDSLDITGCVTVNANNVTIKRSRVTCNGTHAILNNGLNLLVEDTTISCSDRAGPSGIHESNYTARRVDVSQCENGMWAGDNTLVEDSYIHDIMEYDLPDCLDDPPGSDTDPCHMDGIQTGFTDNNVIIRHNRIYGEYRGGVQFGNSAMTAGGCATNYLFENNLVAGGGYTVRCELSCTTTNYRVLSNHFSSIFINKVGGFGLQNECTLHGVTFSNNVCHETGAAVTSGTSTCGPAPAPEPEPEALAVIARLRHELSGVIERGVR